MFCSLGFFYYLKKFNISIFVSYKFCCILFYFLIFSSFLSLLLLLFFDLGFIGLCESFYLMYMSDVENNMGLAGLVKTAKCKYIVKTKPLESSLWVSKTIFTRQMCGS